MSLIGAVLSFVAGVFGIAYASAVLIAQDPGMMSPPPGGGSFGSPSGGTMSPPPGGDFGSPSGGSMSQPPGGGSFGGDQGGFGSQGGSGGQQFGGQQGGQQFGGQQGGQQFGGEFGGQGGQGMKGGQGQNGQFGNEFGGQGGQGQEGGQWQGGEGQGQGQDGQQGNQQWGGQGGEGNDEERGKQDEERQKKQEEEGNKRCLKDMQRGMQGMSRPIKDLEKKIAQVKRAKAAVPAAAEEAVAKMKAAIDGVKNAKTCDEAQEFQEGIQESSENMQDIFMQLEFASQAPKIIKQIKQGFSMMDKMWKRALASAKKSKVDLSEQIARGQAIVDELKAMFDQMVAAVNSGDFEIMQNMMEAGDAAEEKRGELEEVVQIIESVKNTGKMISGLNQHLNGLKRAVPQLKRQKKDVTEINACLEAGKQGIAGVKAAAAARPIDLDALIEAFEGTNDVLDQCDGLIREASGQEEEGLFDDFFGGDMQKQIQSRPRQQQGGEEGGTGGEGGFAPGTVGGPGGFAPGTGPDNGFGF